MKIIYMKFEYLKWKISSIKQTYNSAKLNFGMYLYITISKNINSYQNSLTKKRETFINNLLHIYVMCINSFLWD